VINQLEAHGELLGLGPDDRYANWMPLYHDGGLMGGFLQPMLSKLPLSIVSPIDWVRAPALLLRMISTDRSTICWLPNFAYKFMATRISDPKLEGVDLSCMRAFVNSGEPVRVASHQAFLDRFGPYGLSPLALTASYGTAENTLAIAQSDPTRPARIDVVDRLTLSRHRRAVPPRAGMPTIPVVSGGTLLRNTELRVLGEGFEDLPDRQVGEFAIRSDCMLTEYHHRPDLTAQAFHDGWYLTGDYGYTAEGEVFPTGRRKDLIIVAGNNIYPQDLEFIADNTPGVHPGRTVAFGVENEALGTEDVVLVIEAEPGADPSAVERAVKDRVARESDCAARTVHVVPPMWLIKTSSGKISRRRCKEKFLEETAVHGLVPSSGFD
jgi:acyl-CoA synthetase (AMP-forming)/AMP-acid ligase II